MLEILFTCCTQNFDILTSFYTLHFDILHILSSVCNSMPGGSEGSNYSAVSAFPVTPFSDDGFASCLERIR